MTTQTPCPACGRPIAPGAWCDNGHPMRRAPRLTGAEREEARAAAEAERAAETARIPVTPTRPMSRRARTLLALLTLGLLPVGGEEDL